MTHGVDLTSLYVRQKGLCYWCKQPMHLGADNSAAMPTRDHIIPRSRGGSNFMRIGKSKRKKCNVVAACKGCNTKRGSMDAHTFRSVMRPHVQTPP